MIRRINYARAETDDDRKLFSAAHSIASEAGRLLSGLTREQPLPFRDRYPVKRTDNWMMLAAIVEFCDGTFVVGEFTTYDAAHVIKAGKRDRYYWSRLVACQIVVQMLDVGCQRAFSYRYGVDNGNLRRLKRPRRPRTPAVV